MMHFASHIASILVLGFSSSCDGFSFAPSKAYYHAHRATQLAAVANAEDLASLSLPPTKGQNIYRNIRDSLSYLANPERFLRTRVEELGPVFLCYQFFKPLVIVGGQENVKEFISERENRAGVIYPSLPESFETLHTTWGALNLDINDQKFKEARGLFADVLSSAESRGVYSKITYSAVEDYVNDLVDRVKKDPEQAVFLMPELKSFFLQVFSKAISGQGLTKEQEQMFVDYNTALISLSMQSEQYKKGESALNELKGEMLKRFKEAGNDETNTGHWYYKQLAERPGFEDEDRISSGMVLFIWGAYVESADLACNALAQIAGYSDCDLLTNIRQEAELAEESSSDPSEYTYWNEFDYTLGLLRETLRTVPPGGSVPRSSKSDFSLAGYRIPAGMPIQTDPRIGNQDPTLFPEPELFEPLRWVPRDDESSSKCPFAGSATSMKPGSWFPGGIGAHQCPGIPIAEMAGKQIVSKMATTFESWEYSGDGLDKNGEIKYEEIPIKCPVDDFGMTFKPANWSGV